MRLLTSLCLILFVIGNVLAQDGSISETLEEITANLETVETEKFRYVQSMDFDEEKPWRVTITVEKVNLKNEKSVTNSFYLNLADLDPKLVSIKTEKAEQLVVLKTRRRQNFIKDTDDDGDVSYVSEVNLWSPEIDRATALQALFKEAVSEADALWKANFSPATTIGEINEWLAEHIQPVDVDGESIEASWASDAEWADYVNLSLLEPKDEEATAYVFSMADLAKNSTALDTRKGLVSVSLKTVNKELLIREEQGGEVNKYSREVKIPFSGIEEAKQFMIVLEAAGPLAKEERKSRMPSASTLEESIALLTNLINGEFQNGDESVSTTLSKEEVMVLEVTTNQLEKGETEILKYIFDFADLQGKQANLKVKGTTLSVAVPTIKRRSFVQIVDEESAYSFSNEMPIVVKDIETAFQIISLIPSITEEAAKSPVPAMTTEELIEVIIAGSTEDLSQTLVKREDCKWSFTTLQEGKKTKETVYDFNLYDLDPKKIDFDVKGRNILLNINTLRKEETINVYENDEPKFTEIMTWRLDRLLDAKRVKAQLIKMVEGCEE